MTDRTYTCPNCGGEITATDDLVVEKQPQGSPTPTAAAHRVCPTELEEDSPLPTGFIEVHDMDISLPKRYRKAGGRPLLVRASAIHSIRAYDSGDVRCVIGLPSGFVHVAETQSELSDMIEWSETRR